MITQDRTKLNVAVALLIGLAQDVKKCATTEESVISTINFALQYLGLTATVAEPAFSPVEIQKPLATLIDKFPDSLQPAEPTEPAATKTKAKAVKPPGLD